LVLVGVSDTLMNPEAAFAMSLERNPTSVLFLFASASR